MKVHKLNVELNIDQNDSCKSQNSELSSTTTATEGKFEVSLITLSLGNEKVTNLLNSFKIENTKMSIMIVKYT